MPASVTPLAGADPPVQYRILGPLEVCAGERSLNLGGTRQRRILAALLLATSRPVSLFRLVESVWEGAEPATARRQVQNAVAGLRAVLGRAGAADAIETHETGYLLRVGPDQLDALVFEQLVDRARAAAADGDRGGAAAALRQALGLWRGPVLAGLGGHLAEVRATRLEEKRLAVLEEVIELELAAGAHARLVSELRGLVTEHPLRERFVGQLMVALYRGGRQAEALAAYHELAGRLSGELDLDPGPDLRRCYEAVLREDPSLDPPGARSQAVPGDPGAPPAPDAIAQLPDDIPAFTGRRSDLARLDRLLSDGHTDSAVVISAIAGTAGVGKTALAVHWAHRVRDKFANGQLYVNLRGYSCAPMRPIEALALFLRALGVPAGRVPTDQDEAAAMYRSLLADRRVLVVLDNARSPEQVRPLLPGNRECVVLVTSRDQLGGLVALDGARRVTLDVLEPGESVDLLAGVLGAARLAAEPGPAERLAAACGHVPLALRIAAAGLAVAPRERIADRLDRLGASGGGVRAAFDASYAGLPEPAQRVFRLLGAVPVPVLTPATAVVAAAATTAVASAGAGSTAEAQGILDRLVAAQLLIAAGPGRYTMHDELRRFAAELAGGDEAPLRGLYDHYLHAVDAAARRLYPHILRLPLPSPADTGTTSFPDPARAAAWLDEERSNLVAIVRHTAEHGPLDVAWLLADALRGYFTLHTNPVDWLTVAQAALAAAAADGAPRGVAAAHISLAMLHRRLSQYPQSIEHQNRALDLTRRAGWTPGEAAALSNLGGLYAELGRLEEAADHHTRALALERAAGDIAGQAVGLSNLGRVLVSLGRLESAVEHAMQGLALYRRIGSRSGEMSALRHIGAAFQGLGRLDEALDYLTRALALHRDLRDSGDEADYLGVMAQVHVDAGRYDEAGRIAHGILAGAREAGRRPVEADALNLLAEIALRQGQHRPALDQHRQALRLARDSDSAWLQVQAQIGLAQVHRQLGEPDRAQAAAEQAIALAANSSFRVPEGQARTVLAAVHLDASRVSEAVAEAECALAGHTETGHRLGAARTHVVLGRALDRDGRAVAARAHWRTALALLADVGSPEVAEVRALL
jgi:DNA-binding SARP family transcriptional activator/tetratricopeptide (TPR) repeat protein